MEPKQKYDVFISYRREGGDKYARTIQQALEKQYRVFLDFDELKDGVFDQRIINAISNSPVFLLILSKGALDRCINEKDWVRQEILQAVKCGCHIVPVTIDDTFDGIPDSLPEELRNAVGQHQFSELQMKTLFKASMEQLVRDRIAPYLHREDASSGIEVHIDVDADCDMFRFNTFVRHLKAGEDNVIHMNPGKHKLGFISSQEPEVKSLQVYQLTADMTCDFFVVELKEKIEEVIVKRKAEAEAKRKAEEEAQRKAEAEAKRKAEEEAKRRAEEEARRKAEAEAKRKAEAEAKRKAEAEAKRRAEEEARRKAEAEAKRKAEEETKRKEEAEAQRIKDEKERQRAEDTKLRFVIARKKLFGIEFGGDSYGFADELGKVVIPCQWKWAETFSEGLARVQDWWWGYLDKSGELVIPCQWWEAKSFSEGLAAVKDVNNKWGFIDKTGKVVIPCQWEFAKQFSEGLAAVRNDISKWGFIDKTGNVVIPCQWVWAETFSEGLAAVGNNYSEMGFIDKTGKVVIPCQWRISVGFSEGLAAVGDDISKWGFIVETGKAVIP